MSKRGIWLLRFMVFVVPLALFGPYVIGFVTWLCDVALVSSNPQLVPEHVLHHPRLFVASPHARRPRVIRSCLQATSDTQELDPG